MRKPFKGSILFLIAGITQAAAVTPASHVIANNTPRFVANAQKGSNVDPSSVIEVALWLEPQNRDALDKTVAKLYDRSSPSFHKWLSRDAMGQLLAPRGSDMADVKKFLKGANLSIVSQDKYNFFVRARGTVADVQKAFNVTLANVTFKGATYRSNLADPAIADPSGAHVMAIEGLDNVAYIHHNIAQTSAIKGVQPSAVKTNASSSASAAAAGSTTPLACITGTGSETYTSQSGANPSATFTGNLYTTSVIGCGFTPPQIQAAYGLTKLYASGFDGTGQTVVILDWCGSPTIKSDANAYSKKYGLPALTDSNFQIVNYPAPSSCAAPDPEINIDVEWAHAIAPGANILLMVPPSAEFVDIDSALLYIVENAVGNVVSNSYGAEELYTDPTILSVQNFILEGAASVGVAMNFSTGDEGDFTFDFPQFDPPSVSDPADSPYATGIGGISLQMTPSSTIDWQAAWGNNVTLLSEPGFIPVPAANFGFNGGSGGGASGVFAKPSYQSALKGKYRKLPDISWLADPFTGGVIAISEPFQSPSLIYTVYGGTSLACPMFSALWAIADQVAGASLGQAAPALYAAPSSVYTDIVPYGSATNVTGVLTRANGKTITETAAQLAKPLEGNTTFLSAIWNYPDNQGLAYMLTFGTDSGLKPTPGWDNATGLGVTNPQALVSYISSLAASKK
jgi:subtilase family serine protease